MASAVNHPECTDLSIISSAFQEKESNRYNLVLRLGMERVNWLVADSASHKLLCLFSKVKQTDDARDEIRIMEEAFAQHPWLKGTFHSTHIVSVNQKATLIPYSLYKPEEKRHYLSFNIDLDPEEVILSTSIPSIKAQCIFAMDGKQHFLLTQWFSLPLFHHIAAIPPPHFLGKQHSIKDSPVVTLYISGNLFFVHVFRKHELVFFNSFNFSNPEEFVYYLLNILDKVSAKPAATPFILSGDIEPQSALYTTLQHSFPGISMSLPPKSIHWDDAFEKVEWHRFFDLLTLVA